MEFGVRHRPTNVGDDPFCHLHSDTPKKVGISLSKQRMIFSILSAAIMMMFLFVFYKLTHRNHLCNKVSSPCSFDKDCCSYNCGNDGLCLAPYWDCNGVGHKCQEDSQCCSWSCLQGICHNPQTCLTTDKPCTENEQCCSYRCLNGICSDQSYQCTSTGMACKEDTQCCTYLCKAGNCSECENTDAPCSRDEECCSYRCRSEKCAECYEHGETCEIDDDCCSMLCHEYKCEYHEEYDGYSEEWNGSEYEPLADDLNHEHEHEHEHHHHEVLEEDTHSDTDLIPKTFIASDHYDGRRKGYVWRTGHRGLGYYPAHLEEIIAEHKQQHEGHAPHGKLSDDKQHVV